MTKVRRYLIKEEILAVWKHYQAGLTYAEIGRKFGATGGCIKNWVDDIKCLFDGRPIIWHCQKGNKALVAAFKELENNQKELFPMLEVKPMEKHDVYVAISSRTLNVNALLKYINFGNQKLAEAVTFTDANTGETILTINNK